MQFGEFTTLIRNIVTNENTTFLTTVKPDVLNLQINRYLSTFCVQTRLLYSEQILATFQANVSRYSVRDLAFVGQPIAYPEVLTFNGNVLYDFDGRVGAVSVDQMRERFATYNTDPASTPQRWWWTPPNNIQIWPSATAEVIAISPSTTFFSGYTLHPTMANATDVLSVPDEYCESCACFVAHKLMNPRIDDEEVLKLVGEYSAQAAAEIAIMVGRNEQARDRAYTRGNRFGWRRIGY